ncbi:hypothetical protein [Kribbella sp. CA-293567]|uniref:hypothetical protein n=1 Tax=Kribbella sp. CA-293567 TaxID=3002436 RepID=UPI0022DCEE5F|nr:hypothetical protein [Kribbella sp. CA-293567]WBQ08335.1 hypothetical protein OX958_16340 [Kribbella sp. CA-293567]
MSQRDDENRLNGEDVESRDGGDLPLTDFDHLPFGSLTSRIRALDAGQLETLISYEREHSQRIAVLEALGHRLEALNNGAEPTDGDPNAERPEVAGPPDAGSRVGAEDGPALNPPAHGDPTNPAQPRT